MIYSNPGELSSVTDFKPLKQFMTQKYQFIVIYISLLNDYGEYVFIYFF